MKEGKKKRNKSLACNDNQSNSKQEQLQNSTLPRRSQKSLFYNIVYDVVVVVVVVAVAIVS